ncbi:MAG: hypothetical protein RBT76_03555 [candidate division Zixibacteria bacterium]|jgi:hypothetical protein|nr:hypothetical protein [candidate division Zixibacteria bacterium]
MHVGGYLTPFVVNGDSIVALVPLFLEEGGLWPKIPSGAQDVFIIKGADTVAQALGALTIDTLPHADGTMDSIAQDLQIISSSLGEVLNSLAQLPGQDERLEGYRLAISFMLDSLISGVDSSIQSILSGSSSWTAQEDSALALQDAVMASCGALDYYNEFANSVGKFSQKISSTKSSIFCRDGGPDMDLACQMQIYTILEDYKNLVVKPTAQTYAESVKIGADLIAISGIAALPILVINSIMSVWEFVYGTLAPSLFPAEITAFTLTLESDTIGVGEPTYSTIAISARNIPSTIKATQILDVLIDALAAKGVPQGLVTEFREILKETIKFALDLYRKCLVAYNDSQGGAIFIDPEADLPEMTWGPVTINHSDLVELFSIEPTILKPDTSILEWIGMEKGEGAIQARGRTAGEQAKVLIDHALCAICVYSGGAFGNASPGTETKTVVVGNPATLHVQITGLPGGTDGSVFVDGPSGYSSGKITQSTVLSPLESGSYHIYSFAVLDADNYEYVPKPVDTTITLDDEDDVTIDIEYTAKYGSILVTVSGLPEGIEADIDLTGDGVFTHIVTDTLIDSLLAGTYTVVARDVDDGTGNLLSADPASQTVEVIGRQTSTAAVNYGGSITMTVHVGNPYELITPRGQGPYTKLAEARYSVDGIQVESKQDYYTYVLHGPSGEPAYTCTGGDSLGGGNHLGTITASAVTTEAAAECELSFNPLDDKSMTIDFSGYTRADVTGHGYASGTAALRFETWAWVVLEIDNKTSQSYGLWYAYDFTATSEYTYQGQITGYSARFDLGSKVVSSCDVLGILEHPTIDYSRLFRLDGEYNATTNLNDENQFRSIPPGKTFVQLFTGIYCASTSKASEPNPNDPPHRQSATFSGSIKLELRQ